MKQISIPLLRVVLIFIGLSALVFLLLEPHFEGRNIHATFFEIYFTDPFLAYIYTVSIAFFTALHQAYRLLGYIEQDKLYSPNSMRALRMVQYSATIIAISVGSAVLYLFVVQPGDDIAGGVAVGSVVILFSIGIAITVGVFEKIVRRNI